MPLGGFAPCPLPLGGTALDGLTAEQHARLASDLRSVIQTAPFAVIRFSTNSTVPLAYLGQHDVGIPAAPTITLLGAGRVRLTWNTSYRDEYDNAFAVNFRTVAASAAFSGGNAPAVNAIIQTTNMMEVHAFIVVAGIPTFVNTDVSLVVW